MDLCERGLTQDQLSSELQVSKPTLAKRIADVQGKQGILLKYRAIQSLQLTELQAKCLEAITDDKIEAASLDELVRAYKILKEKEQVIEGRPTEIKDLVSYLIHIEKEEAALKAPHNPDEPVIELKQGGNGKNWEVDEPKL